MKGKNRYVSNTEIKIKNTKGDNLVILEQKVYSEYLYTIKSINGKQPTNNSNFEHLESAIKSTI